jgi:hypothetical protein
MLQGIRGSVPSHALNRFAALSVALAIFRSAADRGLAQDKFRRSTVEHRIVQARSTKAILVLRRAPVRAARLPPS